MVKVSAAFHALADDTRLRLLFLFLSQETDLCVCEMVSALGLPQYQVSRHLSVLRRAGLLRAVRKGTWAYYSLLKEEPFIRELLELLAGVSKDARSEEDRGRLEARLALRARGECVVGAVGVERSRNGSGVERCHRPMKFVDKEVFIGYIGK